MTKSATHKFLFAVLCALTLFTFAVKGENSGTQGQSATESSELLPSTWNKSQLTYALIGDIANDVEQIVAQQMVKLSRATGIEILRGRIPDIVLVYDRRAIVDLFENPSRFEALGLTMRSIESVRGVMPKPEAGRDACNALSLARPGVPVSFGLVLAQSQSVRCTSIGMLANAFGVSTADDPDKVALEAVCRLYRAVAAGAETKADLEKLLPSLNSKCHSAP